MATDPIPFTPEFLGHDEYPGFFHGVISVAGQQAAEFRRKCGCPNDDDQVYQD